jgi:hypothetical protein
VLGTAALIVFGLAYDPWSFFIFAACLSVLATVAALPFLLLGRWGSRQRRSGRFGGRILQGISLIGLFAVALCICVAFLESSPFFEKIIARGATPDGREYAISQAWVDWFDCYSLMLFMRGEDGKWRSTWGGRDWNPLSRFSVRFSHPYFEVILYDKDGKGRARPFETGRPYLNHIFSADLSPEELHAFHSMECRLQRDRPRPRPTSTTPSTPHP